MPSPFDDIYRGVQVNNVRLDTGEREILHSYWSAPSPVDVKPLYNRKPCEIPGCANVSRSRGLCKAHGGGRRCQVEGCAKGIK